MNYLLNNWLAAVLLSLGIFAVVVGWKSASRASEASTWPSTEGMVEKSSIVTKQRTRSRRRKARKQTVHRPNIEFSYYVDGVSLLNKQTSFGSQSAHQVIQKYPAGSVVTVFFNPDDVNDSMLELPSADNTPVIFVMGGVFMVAGIGSAIGPMFRKSRKIG